MKPDERKKDKLDEKKKDKDVAFSHKFQAGGYSQMRKKVRKRKTVTVILKY